jgi:hypothetical protein
MCLVPCYCRPNTCPRNRLLFSHLGPVSGQSVAPCWGCTRTTRAIQVASLPIIRWIATVHRGKLVQGSYPRRENCEKCGLKQRCSSGSARQLLIPAVWSSGARHQLGLTFRSHWPYVHVACTRADRPRRQNVLSILGLPPQ